MMWYFAIVILAIIAVLPALDVVGDDHIVGANHGWQVPSEAGVDLNYSKWSAQETFYLGDFISFHYQKGLHTVYEVNKTVYESCDFGNGSSSSSTNGDVAVGAPAALAETYNNSVEHNWSTKGGRSIVALNESRVYYFACGVRQHCLQGMKVAVSVLPMARRPSLSTAQQEGAYSHSSSSSLHLLSLCHLSLFLIHVLVLFLAPP